ncbi:MAG: UvrD-helicase domain-containing protein [Bacteroidetes bacterium]|nr:UvrD-helicase domain-containing protein [Bacteroidota bacterium]
MEDFLLNLNEPQREAVTTTDGPLMIIAGAGSGKTRVLTYRIAYLLKKGIDPFNIIALTFTNKAAREMRERIEKVAGTEARNLWMGTFHSIFAKILRIEADKLGYTSHFTIYDTEDSKSVIKAVLKELNLDDKVYKPSMILNRISNAKNNLITAAMYAQNEEVTAYDISSGKPQMSKIYAAYEMKCFKSGAMDFDDLLLKTYILFSKFPSALNKYQHKFKYILVDEYQDTNHCQFMIVKKLAAVYRNICVVGDDSQSIYSFRGATIKNILTFESEYPELKVIKLEQNYRSTQNIVNASDSIIKRNKDQISKKIWTQNNEGEKIKVLKAINDNEEGKFVAQTIFEMRMSKNLQNNNFAILYRTNAQSRSFEEALRKMNIPYKVYGGMSFYQRKEIKDFISYLRFISNQNDEEALKRIINYPMRGIGQTTIDRIIYLSGVYDIPLWQVVENANTFTELKSASSKVVDFAMMIKSFLVLKDKNNVYELSAYVAKVTGLLKILHEDKTIEGISRYENIVSLLNSIKEFAEDDTNEQEKTLENYLQDIALLTDTDKDETDFDKVSLMTIHSAKGLEFPVVFVGGIEENLFPSQMSLSNRKDLEEERRLFYVALTRAKEKVILSYATSRFKFGTLMPCEPSRFLDEIDKEFIENDKFYNIVNDRDDAYTSQSKNSSFSKFKNSILSKPENKPLPNPIENFIPENITDLTENMRIEHIRFGKGTVTKVEGLGENIKASVLFDDFGEKQLVIKFAKIRKI